MVFLAKVENSEAIQRQIVNLLDEQSGCFLEILIKMFRIKLLLTQSQLHTQFHRSQRILYFMSYTPGHIAKLTPAAIWPVSLHSAAAGQPSRYTVQPAPQLIIIRIFNFAFVPVSLTSRNFNAKSEIIWQSRPSQPGHHHR